MPGTTFVAKNNLRFSAYGKATVTTERTFAPPQIPNLALWLDAADGDSLIFRGRSAPNRSNLVFDFNASTWDGTGSWPNAGSTGTSYNASLAAGTRQKNAAGNGVIFDGSTFYNTGGFNLGNNFTVSAWFKRTGVGAGRSCILCEPIGGGGDGRTQFYLVTNGDGASGTQFVAGANEKFSYSGTAVEFPLDTWQEITITFAKSSSSVIKTYVNGNLVGTASSANIGFWGGGLRIGGQLSGGSGILGELGRLMVYTRLLNDQEVYQNYQMTSQSFMTVDPTLSARTVIGWKNKSITRDQATIVGTLTYDSAEREVQTDISGAYFRVPVNSRKVASTNFNVFTVHRWLSSVAGGNQVLWGCDTGGGFNRAQLLSFPSATPFGLGTGGSFVAVSGLNTTNRVLYGAMYSLGASNGSFGLVNGQIQATFTEGSAVTQTSDTNTYFGRVDPSNNPSSVGFSEVLIYNGTLTSFQRQQIEGYLAWKWGLQSTLDAQHMFKNNPPTVTF